MKTPLNVLGADAQRLRERGETEIAEEIDEIAATMWRHVERTLAKARLRPGRGAATALAPLGRAPDGDHAQDAVRRGAAVGDRYCRLPGRAVDPDDLVELLGNLFDNAAKWARRRVRIGAAADGATVIIRVDDDGPGIPEAERHAVLERGVRLDQMTAGSGLGLAIAGDVLEACGGALRLEDSPLGGLRVVVVAPSPANEARGASPRR